MSELLRHLLPDGWRESAKKKKDYWEIICEKDEKVTGMNRGAVTYEISQTIDTLKREFGSNILEVTGDGIKNPRIVLYLRA